MRIGNDEYTKYLPKKNLLRLIEDTPDDVFFAVNQVGNLMVVTKNKDGETVYLGYIDFLIEGEYCT